MQEKQEVAIGDEEEEDDGPPPGFQCIINPQPPKAGNAEVGGGEEDEEDDDEGPPPGFDAVVPKPTSSPPDIAKSSQEGDDDNEDEPPPGWEVCNLVDALPKPPSKEADLKLESDEDLDEGPPPGWEKVLPHHTPPRSMVPMQSSSSVSSAIVDVEMGSKQAIPGIDDEVPPSMQGHSSPAAPLVQKLPFSELESDTGMKEEENKTGDRKPMSVLQPASSLQQLPPTSLPGTSTSAKSSSEKAQLVCGTCRKLCVYPRGPKWVQCPECQEVNYVLEAHEVGQVKCDGCAVLLMYPHGVPAVQCTSCRTVTEIGAHNRRQLLSVQIQQVQRRRRPRLAP